MELQRLQIAQSWKEQNWRTHNPWFQNLLQSYSNQDSEVLALRLDLQIDGIELEVQKYIHGKLIFDKGSKTIQQMVPR